MGDSIMALRALVFRAATVAFVLAAGLSGPSTAAASGSLLDVRVIDRSRNVELPVIRHQGKRYVTGTPGTEYAVMLRNRAGGDLLAVLSVDGVNAVSGETARPDQTGYVLRPREQAEIRGWRKDLYRTAAFHFTTLPESYAARTGRPDDVGVIGVAVFRAAAPPPVGIARQQPYPPDAAESESSGLRQRSEAAAAAAGAASVPRAADVSAAPASPLGTGHGRTEHSTVRHLQFTRASAVPDEVVTIFYDSRANLVARGILPPQLPPLARAPQPFPGFVPDPPAR
jgi:hypothetical protein